MGLEAHRYFFIAKKGFHILNIACEGKVKEMGETITIGDEVSIRRWSVSPSNLTKTMASTCDPICNEREDW